MAKVGLMAILFGSVFQIGTTRKVKLLARKLVLRWERNKYRLLPLQLYVWGLNEKKSSTLTLSMPVIILYVWTKSVFNLRRPSVTCLQRS